MSRLLEIFPHQHRDNLFDQTSGTTHLTIDSAGGLHLSYGPDDHPIMVTARPTHEYQWYGAVPANALSLIVMHKFRLIEVGPGPSEFIQEVARQTDVMPMSIDPFSEENTDQLLAIAYPQAPTDTKEKIQILRERIAFLTTSDRIARIRMPLETAYATLYRELFHFADVVLDYNGATMYGGPGSINMETRWLLKTHRDPKYFYWCGGRFAYKEQLHIP